MVNVADRKLNKDPSLTSNLAIISGASAGIGAKTATLFTDQGYRCINLSRRPCPDERVENWLTDFSDPQAVASTAQGLAHELSQQASRVCLVHNAALMLKDRCDSTADADLHRVLQVNVAAINTLNGALLPHLSSGSSVLYIGSTLAEKAVAGAFSYVVSKHAQTGMMRATCQDLMGRGVHTAMICPGFTDTEMLRAHLGHDPTIVEAISSQNSFGRLVNPTEIADMIWWAHQSPVINGAILHGNLGQIEH